MFTLLFVAIVILIVALNLFSESNKDTEKNKNSNHLDPLRGYIGDGLAPSEANSYGLGEKTLLDDDY